MTWKHVLIALFVGLAAFFFARLATGQTATTKRGAELYGRYCSSCHGPTAKGDGLLAEAMKKKMPNLRQIAKRRDGLFPKKEIQSFIDGRKDLPEHGSRTMPVWGTRLFDEAPHDRPHQKEAHVDNRMLAIVKYLQSIQEK